MGTNALESFSHTSRPSHQAAENKVVAQTANSNYNTIILCVSSGHHRVHVDVQQHGITAAINPSGPSAPIQPLAVASTSKDPSFGAAPSPNTLSAPSRTSIGAFPKQTIGSLARKHAVGKKRPQPDSDSDEEYSPDEDVGNNKKHKENLMSSDHKTLRRREKKVNYNLEGIFC